MDGVNHISLKWRGNVPANIYLFKVNIKNNRSARKRCEICSKLTIKTPEQHQRHRSGVLLLTSNIFQTFIFFTLSKILFAWVADAQYEKNY